MRCEPLNPNQINGLAMRPMTVNDGGDGGGFTYWRSDILSNGKNLVNNVIVSNANIVLVRQSSCTRPHTAIYSSTINEL